MPQFDARTHDRSLSGSLNGADEPFLASSAYQQEETSSGCLPAKCCCGRCSATYCITTTALSIVVAVLAMAGLGIFVIAPNIAQGELNDATLAFEAINISNPRGMRFDMSAAVTVANVHPLGATLSPLPLTMYFQGAPFATTTLPAQAIVAGKPTNFVAFSVVQVQDQETFTAFSRALVEQDSVEWRVSGKAAVTCTVAGITQTLTGLDFDKTVTTRGASGLGHVVVRRFSLAESTPEEVVAQLHTALYSPSIVSITGMGAVCVNVTYNGTQVGISRAENVGLTAGWSDVVFEGPLNPTDPVARNDLFDKYLSGAVTGVQAAAFACEGTARLFRGVVPALKLGVELPGSPFPLVRSMHVGGLEMVPQNEARVGIRLNATVTLNDPLGAGGGLVVETVGMRGNLFGDGEDVGTLVVPETPVGPAAFSSRRPRLSAGRVQARVSGTRRPLVSSRTAVQPYRAEELQSLAEAGIPPPPPPLPHDTPWPLNVSLSVEGELELSGPGLNDTASAFATFVDRFLLNDTVTMEVSSTERTALQTRIRCGIGEVTVNVPLHLPTTTVPGAAGIPGVRVLSFDVVGQAQGSNGLAIRLVTEMHNPSSAVVPMGGECIFGVYGGPEEVRIGSVSVYNASLRPGRNVLAMTGTIDPPAEGLPFIGTMFTNYLAGVSTLTTTRGESVLPGPGRDAPSWLQQAIRDVSLVSELPGLQNISLFTDMGVDSLDMAFHSSTNVTLTGQLHGLVHEPFSRISLDILSVTAVLRLLAPDSGAVMAIVHMVDAPAHYTPFQPPVVVDVRSSSFIADAEAMAAAASTLASEPPATGKLVVSVVEPAQVEVVDEEAFATFLAHALLDPTATNTLSLVASQRVKLTIGTVTISNVSAVETVTLPALDSLRSPPARVEDAKLSGADADGLDFSAVLNVTSHSVLGGDFGPSTLRMMYEGEEIGSSSVEHFAVKNGVNALQSTTRFQPADTAAARAAGERFLSAFLTGKDSPVQLHGHKGSTPFPLLAPGVSQLVLNATVPGSAHRLIQNGTMNVSSVSFEDATMLGRIGTINPTTLSSTIIDSKLYVQICKDENPVNDDCGGNWTEPIAVFTPQNLTADPIVVPPMSSLITKPRPFGLIVNIPGLIQTLADYILDGGVVNTQVNGTQTVVIGGAYTARVHYIQAHALLRLHW